MGRSYLRLILYGANMLCFRPSVPYYGLEIPTSISKRSCDQNGKNLSVLITPSLISDTQHNAKIMMAIIHTPFQTSNVKKNLPFSGSTYFYSSLRGPEHPLPGLSLNLFLLRFYETKGICISLREFYEVKPTAEIRGCFRFG